MKQYLLNFNDNISQKNTKVRRFVTSKEFNAY